jgi:hypothetical protein
LSLSKIQFRNSNNNRGIFIPCSENRRHLQSRGNYRGSRPPCRRSVSSVWRKRKQQNAGTEAGCYGQAALAPV